ncbi:amino acid ABC transporter permease [Paenibacillus alkaliterrae]|uniref:amino acid ABC transporter permease n=1 Tax=Paenibacillus alkaliterrae TaxID=320909 RepID=UPI001F3F55BA|nr:amino acid ABC transporter permease [Paenibacillus alkaliterrae]MCF2941568.1 amino acid ABC transporter permease [Paenibacillus alkaliterrae]
MDFTSAYSRDNLSFLLEGFGLTLWLALLAIIFSFVLGCVLGIIRYAKVPVLSPIVGLFVELVRNLPLLLLIFFARFGLPELGVSLPPFWAAITALTLFEAAMIAEIVRSGLNSVDKGWVEAARSSGLSYGQTLQQIILPIGLRRMVPPIVSQFISLLKDTSLTVVITLGEMMHHANIVMGQNSRIVFPILLLVAFMYFIVNYVLSLFARRLEARQT